MPSEVPEGWSGTALGLVAKLVMGQSPPSSLCNDEGRGLPFYQGNAEFGHRHPVASKWIVEEHKVAERGDVLISVRAPVGELNVAGERCVIGRGLAAIRGTKVDPDFTYFLMTERHSHLEALGQGSTFDAINSADLRDLRINLPPLPEQKKIAAILSSVDEAIQATQGVIDQTRRVKKGLLQDLLTRGIGHARVKESLIGEIPEGWEVRRLGDIASVERGRFSHRPRNAPHLYGGEHPFVQTGDIGAAEDLLLDHSQTLNEEGMTYSRKFPVGTILITIAANIGDVALTTYEVACPDSLVGIIPHEVDARWLLYVLAARKQHLDRYAPESAQKNINLQTLRPLRIAVPPKNEQQEIRDVIAGVSATIRRAEAGLECLSQTKAGLLQDLLTGKVRVTP